MPLAPLSMLTLLLVTPLIGILFMLLSNQGSESPLATVQPSRSEAFNVFASRRAMLAHPSVETLKAIALATSIVNFIISLALWSNFDRNTSCFQFVAEYNELSFCHFTLGVDGISLFFIILTCLLFPIIFLADSKAIKENVLTYLVIMLLLETLLIAVFTVKDILLFYIFFESILPPLFLLIGLFGSSKKVRASFHLF